MGNPAERGQLQIKRTAELQNAVSFHGATNGQITQPWGEYDAATALRNALSPLAEIPKPTTNGHAPINADRLVPYIPGASEHNGNHHNGQNGHVERGTFDDLDVAVNEMFGPHRPSQERQNGEHISSVLRERALSGEYDPYRDDAAMRYRLNLSEGTKIPNFEEVLSMADLVSLKEKQGLHITLVVPTRNEGTDEKTGESNIRRTIHNVRALKETGLVDKLWVIDSNSTDDTRDICKEEDVNCTNAEDALYEIGIDVPHGKGTNLGLAALAVPEMHDEIPDEKQLVIFCDADFGARPSQIQGVISPLIADPHKQMSLAWMVRETKAGDPTAKPKRGGRATEFNFKPNIRKWYPELAGLQQPICGLYAMRGTSLQDAEFPVDYRIETALLIQTLRNANFDPSVFAQTYCGIKSQTGQSDEKIGAMATQISDEVAEQGLYDYDYNYRRPARVKGYQEFFTTKAEDGVMQISDHFEIFRGEARNMPSPRTVHATFSVN